jgi:hypothetical protein
MKTIFLLAISLSLTNASQAQIKTFFKTYGNPLYNAGRSLIQNADGGYVIAGQTTIVDSDINVYVLKLDANGDTLWTEDYGSAVLDGGNNVIRTPNGGYLITGHTEQAVDKELPGDCDAYLTQLDSNGKIQWQDVFGSYLDDVPLISALTPDGGFIVTGFTENYGAVQYDVWVFKFKDGLLQWMNIYGGSGIDKGRDVITTPDGGYLIVGQTNSFGNGGYDAYVIKIDSAGNAEWSNTYGGPLDDFAYSVRLTQDGNGYIIAGASTGADSIQYAALWRIDLNGNLLWQKSYGAGVKDFFLGMDVCADGGYIATGGSATLDPLEDVYLVKTDANGNLEWQKYFGNKGFDRGTSVLQALDGGFALTGEVTSMGEPNGDAFLIKTDMFGNILTTGINPVLNKNEARVFPNPANKFVYVITDAQLTGDNPQFLLYDIMGKEVFSTPITSNESMVNVSQFAKGIYEYRVMGKTTGTAGYGKLVIQ